MKSQNRSHFHSYYIFIAVLGPGLVGAGGVLLKKIGGQIGEFANRKAGRGGGPATRGSMAGKIERVVFNMEVTVCVHKPSILRYSAKHQFRTESQH
jgi:hypothetical protein